MSNHYKTYFVLLYRWLAQDSFTLSSSAYTLLSSGHLLDISLLYSLISVVVGQQTLDSPSVDNTSSKFLLKNRKYMLHSVDVTQKIIQRLKYGPQVRYQHRERAIKAVDDIERGRPLLVSVFICPLSP